ncbi:radical SAM additional 4Fe4S-binding SPASM domain-containing protein [Saccharopolyspora antimicrobica]|uniref:Radical SAM additional 4Fe4S-binding SPASM domain-containing protein n=1 Tax=Saccharopolyspora antimicrobica TaxID=455193 RepID=A0A1I4W344_9PSEU|nr:radical SAM protein [Saccharopolyspora antimicrobica]RKT87092.1 radical SAM protein with 4Fe4S-binding SPASM domain [Saccharopolyspora antimicrobica]SFN07827.1 radical SAM additional 4Fe4S-binding SPASM domain-containing protein [Saccharopolyspora antimicrobica]
MNSKEFEDIKHTVSIRSRARRKQLADPGYAAPLPQEISLQLTYRCNLRCSHCYQWSEQGFFRDYSPTRQRTELAIDIVEQVLAATADNRAKLFLWGGEPLMHSRFSEVAQLLRRYPRTVNMCTNGLLLQRKLNDLLAIGEHLNLLVSLDGLGDDHDALRGQGTFARTVRNIETMLDLKRSGRFGGELSLSCTVSHVNVGKMYEFMEWAEDLGVNTVYFQFPWYISEGVAKAMDSVYQEHFAWLRPNTGTHWPTWHSYTYRLPAKQLPVLRDSMRRLATRLWRIRVRYQPHLEEDEVTDFILGTSRPAQRRSKCLAVSNRLEVHADGNVSSCKFFPEFVVGNLYETNVSQLWQSPTFRKVRTILATNGMMPVCSKCILLYLNGV